MTQTDSQQTYPVFPDTDLALDEPNGLLASGGSLSLNWLLAAYHRGIFPWFNDDEPLLWWSPNPRMVLLPSQVHLNRSFHRQLKKSPITHVTFDQCFDTIITRCAHRGTEMGTWITDDMIAAYCDAHRAGLAHSVEVWAGDTLAGGLYGIVMGRVFFGESMFSNLAGGSRVALLGLITAHPQLAMIDCQVPSDHLLAFGAQLIDRKEFEQRLSDYRPEHLKQALDSARQWAWQQFISKEQLTQQAASHEQ